MSEPAFPKPIRQGNRNYFRSDQCDNYLRALMGEPLLDPTPIDEVRLIPERDFRKRLGISQRAVSRRLEAGKAHALAENATA